MTPTEQAIAVVRRYLVPLELEARGLVYVGQELTEQEADATEAAAYAWDSVTWAQQVLENAASWPADYAREQLYRSVELLAEARRLAIRSGAEDLGYAIDVLGDSTAQAIADLGEGAGAGFRAYWGLSPAAAGGGLILAGLAGLALLLWGAPALVGATGGAFARLTVAGGRSIEYAGRGVAPVARELMPIRLGVK